MVVQAMRWKGGAGPVSMALATSLSARGCVRTITPTKWHAQACRASAAWTAEGSKKRNWKTLSLLSCEGGREGEDVGGGGGMAKDEGGPGRLFSWVSAPSLWS